MISRSRNGVEASSDAPLSHLYDIKRAQCPTFVTPFLERPCRSGQPGVWESLGCSVHLIPMNTCPSCMHQATKRDGYDAIGRQRYHCRPCQQDFTVHSLSAFSGYRWPSDVIVMAVCSYERQSPNGP